MIDFCVSVSSNSKSDEQPALWGGELAGVAAGGGGRRGAGLPRLRAAAVLRAGGRRRRRARALRRLRGETVRLALCICWPINPDGSVSAPFAGTAYRVKYFKLIY